MLWMKSFHIISMVCWFSALFYLPRLFVYHTMNNDQISYDRFTLMEKKLYFGIAIPSMLATIIFGVWMMSQNFSLYMKLGWMHAKLFLVILLVIYHHICGYYHKQFAKKKNTHSHIFYRWFNEVPVIILIGSVCLAVVKPL